MQQIERDLLNRLNHAVFVLVPDETGAPVYDCFNRFACDVLGRPEDEILGRTAREVYPGRFGRVAYAHHVAAMESGKTRRYELYLPTGGGERMVQTTLEPVRDSQGRVTRIIGSSTDITGQNIIRQMQAGVETMQFEAEDFVSLAAHDLRAPLRHVSVIADMLKDEFVDMGDGKLELIDMLEDLGTRAMALISDVLSHADATSAAEDRSEFDFSTLVEEVMGLLDPMGLCDVEIEQALVRGDKTATQIALRNIVDNAIKFGGHAAQDVRLKLVFSIFDCGDGFVEITIRDNGTGFDDPGLVFLQTGKLRTGGGFGLYGVRRMLLARGGSITAENIGDRAGALVRFRVPGNVITGQPKAMPQDFVQQRL